MPVTITAVTNKGDEVQWNRDFQGLDSIVAWVKALRKTSPNIVRVIIDIALPVDGDIP